jgi:hypothetical protein
MESGQVAEESGNFVGDPRVQVYGTVEVIDASADTDAFVEYYRGIAGEHPDSNEYRGAMIKRGKALLRIALERRSPIATGGLPADLVQKLTDVHALRSPRRPSGRAPSGLHRSCKWSGLSRSL